MALFEAFSRKNTAGYSDVAVADVTLPAPDVRIVDVREPDEFYGELGHVPGSELIPMNDMPAAVETWDPNLEYLLVCRSGVRSGHVAHFMARNGFTRAMNLTGGMIAWNAAGRKIER